MMNCDDFIKENGLIKEGEIIGVGCSGGSDSIALLHYLSGVQEKLDIEVVAIHIDHQIREDSYIDADLVKALARDLGIRYYKFRVDVPKLAKEKGQGLEECARDARYGVFKSVLQKGLVDKIALAHHAEDQAETILMHIFRGSGLAGAKGMEAKSDKAFIRPMLNVTKAEIYQYVEDNRLEYREDYTNKDTAYNRNFVRNVLFPDIVSRWPNAVQAIVNFGKSVKEDDDYIKKQVYDDALIYEEKTVKIPISYFLYDKAIVSRVIFKALKNIGIVKDVERKHINLIYQLVKQGENGSKINLPFEAVVVKEYDFLTISNKRKEKVVLNQPFKCGEFSVAGFGSVVVRRVKEFDGQNGLLLDYRKVPKDAIWRFRQDGDVFTKFGGGTKKLKSYMIDKKIPQRKRDLIPVLASGSEILAIAGVEISDKVKVENVPTAILIQVK
ncbi:MAG: tRNA lysidine(34) synthetase TilS [Clostridiales bacterium]|nr:tRNA lysidine(34) synthetase TilS [Clostridiales bacterium]